MRLLSDDAVPWLTRPGAPGYLEPAGAATTFINQARLRYGLPTVMEIQDRRQLKRSGEAFRTAFAEEPVWVVHQVLAQGKTATGKLLLKTASRRYRALSPPETDDRDAFFKSVKKLMRAGAPARMSCLTDLKKASRSSVSGGDSAR